MNARRDFQTRWCIRSLLVWTLILQQIWGGAAMAVDGVFSTQPSHGERTQAVAEAWIDPRVQDILELGHQLTRELPIDHDSLDAMQDPDPFFLRSQHWCQAEEKAAGTLRLEGSRTQLCLDQPFELVSATEDLLFLTRLVSAVGGEAPEQNAADGLFVVERAQFNLARIQEMPVPLYYLPLPGSDWAGLGAKASAPTRTRRLPEVRELPSHYIVSSTGGVTFPISKAEVQDVLRQGKINLELAVLDVAESLVASAQPKDRATFEKIFSVDQSLIESKLEEFIASQKLLPAIGSTSGYGLFLHRVGSVSRKMGWLQWQSLRRMIPSLMQSAWAMHGAPELALHSAVAYSAQAVGIFGLILISSYVARWTILRQEAEKRLAQEKVKASETGKFQESKVRTRIYWDIVAHASTTVGQFAPVASAEAVQWVLDWARLSTNRVIRGLYSGTFGFSARTSTRTRVSAKTLYYGTVVLGGFYIAFSTVRAYFLLPILSHALAAAVPSLAPRIYAAFDPNNSTTSLYLMAGIVGNIGHFIANGAQAFSNNIQVIKVNEGERLVRQAMQEEGLDPLQKDRAEFDRRMREYVDLAMRQQGLPEEKDFWFDVNTLVIQAKALIGYAAPAGADPEKVSGVARVGLLPRAISRARARLKRMSEEPSLIAENTVPRREASRACEILEREFSFLQQLQHPSRDWLTPSGMVRVAQRVRAARRVVTAMTTPEPMTGAVLAELLQPEFEQLGIRYDSESIAELSRVFRESFFELLEKPLNHEPSWPDEAVVVPSGVSGLFVRWQIRRAVLRADRGFLEATQRSPEFENEQDAADWQRRFRDELVREAGLNPDPVVADLLRDMDEIAAKKLAQRLREDPVLRLKLEELSARDQRILLGRISASLFTQEYVDETINRQRVGPLDPAQPGRFQNIRIRWLRNSPTLTKVVRLVEGLGSNSRYKLGLWAMLLRNVPLMEDVWQANVLSARQFPYWFLFGYWWQTHFWGNPLQPMDWFVSWALASMTVRGPWMTVLRSSTNVGLRPNEKVGQNLKYSVLGGLATAPSLFIFPMYQEDIKRWVATAAKVCSILLGAE